MSFGRSNQILTNHLNQVDKTNNNKFICDEEREGRIPFIDALVVNIVNPEDISVKIMVDHIFTHMDQYLLFTSHHPINKHWE